MTVQNNEYTKMSIHCHLGGSEADCKINTPTSHMPSFNLTSAYKSIDDACEAGFTLLAQTNSNNIDAGAWLLVRKYAKHKGIELLPGAEINLQNWVNDEILHVVVVLPPNANVFLFQQALRDACVNNGKNAITIEQLCELLCESRAVICIHGIKQRNRSISKNPQMAKELIGLNHYFPVAFEDNKSFHKEVLISSIKDFLSERQAKWLNASADVSSADRTNFFDIESPTYIWAGNTFEDLYYCVLTGSMRIVREEDIVTRPSYIARIAISSNGQMADSNIACSQGLNCIIGPSGSGKTLLLDMLKYKMKEEHLTETTSSKANYSSMFKSDDIHLFGPDGKELDSSYGFEVIEGENLYQKVLRAYQDERTELMRELGLEVDANRFHSVVQEFEKSANDYLNIRQTIDRAKKEAETALAQIKSADAFVQANNTERANVISFSQDSSIKTSIATLTTSKRDCESDLTEAKKSFKTLREIAERQQLSAELMKSIDLLANELLAQLRIKILDFDQRITNLHFKQQCQALLFSACQEYNGKVSQQYEQLTEKKQLIKDKLEELAQSLLSSKTNAFKLAAPSFNSEDLADSLALSRSNNAAKLEVEDIKLEFCRDDLKKVFPNKIAARTAGKVKPSAFAESYDFSDKDSVSDMLEVFADNGVTGGLSMTLSTEDVITYRIELEDESGNFRPVDEFSAGMLSKVYVSHFLDSAISNAGSNTIILYDQPESNMEKAFLIETLADKFSKLRKTHQIFVATHEPLLVVNADANEIILASNDKKVNQPNEVSYENRSFVGINGRSSLIEDVADLIDGGTGAVRHRSEVYEGMKS